MFCPSCGQAAQGKERFCRNCGSDLSQQQLGVVPSPFTGEPTPMAVSNVAPSASAPMAAPSPAAPAAAAVPIAVRPVGELRGVGGWLLVFCIWVTIFDPLMDLRLLPYLRYLSTNPMLLLSFGLTAFGVVIGILLWGGNRAGLMLLRAYFPVVAILSVFGLVRYLAAMQRVPFEPWFLWTLVSSWGRVLVFLVVWVWYFRVSVRVRNTYGGNL